MKANILNYINKLEGYKTAIKNCHWSASNMSEHKLFDEIADSVAEIQDVVAEAEQGLHGQVQYNQLKPKSYKISSSKQFLNDLLKDTQAFYKTLTQKDYVGIRSEIESFITEVQKYKYLLAICLKEDRKRSGKKLNEGKINKVRLTENQLHQLIKESVNILLNEISLGDEAEEEYDPWMNGDASWIRGKYDIPYGFHVEIDPSYSTVAIESHDEEGNKNEENSYFLQGDEADDLIKDIAKYWSEHDCTQEEAVNTVIRGLF